MINYIKICVKVLFVLLSIYGALYLIGNVLSKMHNYLLNYFSPTISDNITYFIILFFAACVVSCFIYDFEKK